MDMIGQLFAVSESVRAIRPEVGELKIGEILRWPGILQTKFSAKRCSRLRWNWPSGAGRFHRHARRREGEKLVALILDRGLDGVPGRNRQAERFPRWLPPIRKS